MSDIDIEKAVQIGTTILIAWATYEYYREATKALKGGYAWEPPDEATYYQKKMQFCQKAAEFFGKQSMKAELKYREVSHG